MKKSGGKTLWKIILQYSAYVLASFFIGIFAVGSYSFLHREPFGSREVLDVIVLSGTAFYFFLSVERNFYQELIKLLSKRWQKVAKKLNLWILINIFSMVFLVAWIFFFKQYLPSIIGTLILAGFLIVLIGFPLVILLVIHIYGCNYLASPKVKIIEKRKTTEALIIITPITGLILIGISYIIMSIGNIEVTVDWIYYILTISVYASIYTIFIDLPFSVGETEKKKFELDKLQKLRISSVNNLRELKFRTQNDLLKKIVYEMEINRIDREIQTIKSRSVHPYKFVIPFASFIFGTVAALIIEYLIQLGL